MKQLFFKFLVAFLITSAVVLSWSEYFFLYGKRCNFRSWRLDLFLSMSEKVQISLTNADLSDSVLLLSNAFIAEFLNVTS